MSDEKILRIDGEVERPVELSYNELDRLPAEHQVGDVNRFDPARRGDAVTLAGVLSLAGVKESGTYLTLHASTDDFHASVPLAAVRDQGVFIYRLEGQPLPLSKGGPVRFLVRDAAACRTDEIDECANVKFVDRLEITAGRGFDNRPTDEEEHAELHRRESDGK
ncbi:MAG: molybdopterin-dependent oxidoreductase [Pirellulales bacterium]|nr:molybdopterin-dependent oxidoreductase [Pirellulales bacterium]